MSAGCHSGSLIDIPGSGFDSWPEHFFSQLKKKYNLCIALFHIFKVVVVLHSFVCDVSDALFNFFFKSLILPEFWSDFPASARILRKTHYNKFHS